MHKRLAPGSRAFIRSNIIAPWCYLVDENGQAKDVHVSVPDNTPCVIWYDAGDSIGAVYNLDGQMITGLFDRHYIWMRM